MKSTLAGSRENVLLVSCQFVVRHFDTSCARVWSRYSRSTNSDYRKPKALFWPPRRRWISEANQSISSARLPRGFLNRTSGSLSEKRRNRTTIARARWRFRASAPASCKHCRPHTSGLS
ncbi:hypothetical protein MPH_01261 [Macrophomina phaseolina MS6]|uniref:Uncharacterized protein n=1 Tax=Macrophomina phaseolina (strain MS6) TaxID=1126212 RepID=K2S943_MACPH|nr:hypothetical protein MPH_01261 [Macrophomina phaseolina MS6]